jgi:class 3 adenylate cyclase/CheY-like chemotaxis protein
LEPDHTDTSSGNKNVEVSFSVFAVNRGEVADVIEKIATAINVQMYLDREVAIPFVNFNFFEQAILADKLFFYGPSGSGKSRIMIEILMQRLGTLDNVYVINPRNATDESSSRTSLLDLINKFGPNDAVVWDNFPDDLIKRDTQSAHSVLEIVSSKNSLVLIALKPGYLEVYRNIASGIPDLYPCPLLYDKRKIKEILHSYGTNVSKFRNLYASAVVKEVDKIATILWHKEPLPISVLNYYKALDMVLSAHTNVSGTSINVNAVYEAEKLLGRTNFYGHQFNLINSDPLRRNDADFLFSLKLCYELGMQRTLVAIKNFQNGIFGTSPPNDPLQRLNTWIYLSGPHYSMHDSCREAIKFDDSTKLRIVSYLVDNFANLSTNSDDNVKAYSLGLFIGRNVDLLADEKARKFLPAQIYDYSKANRHFEEGLGYGVGEAFPLLDEWFQEIILKRVEIDIQFAHAFGESLGLNFESLVDKYKSDILRKVSKSTIFARNFGQTMGKVLFHLNPEIREEIFSEVKSNPQFADGVGIGLGSVLAGLSEGVRKEVMDRSSKDSDFRRGLGCGHGQNFLSLDSNSREEVLEYMKTDDKFAQGFGLGFGHIFNKLPHELQIAGFTWAKDNEHFSYGLGTGIGYRFNYLDAQVQHEVISIQTRKNGEIAQGFGLGLGVVLAYLSKELREEVLSAAKANPRLTIGLGCGHGLKFLYLPNEIQAEIFKWADQELLFAEGLGWGLGYTWTYLNESIRNDTLRRIQRNPGLARGFGWGLGHVFMHDRANFRSKIIELTESNSLFANGLGFGIGGVFNFLDPALQELAYGICKVNYLFAEGFGYGLGYIFKFLSNTMQNEIFSRADSDPLLARGLGAGLGRIFAFLDANMQEQVFERLDRNTRFAEGFANTLAFIFTQDSSQELRDKILHLTNENTSIASGLGFGLGHIFDFLPEMTANDVIAKSANDLYFSIGFGKGLGSKLLFFDKTTRLAIFYPMLQKPDSGFAKGFGIGYGSMFSFQTSEMCELLIAKTREPSQFAIGLGCGISYIWKYLSVESRKQILDRLAENSNPKFTIGVGEGFGIAFRYFDEATGTDILRKVELDTEMMKGFGLGTAQDYHYPISDTEKAVKITRLIDALLTESRPFSLGFGVGLGSIYSPWLERKYIAFMESHTSNSDFESGLGFGLAYKFPAIIRDFNERIVFESERYQSVFQGFGIGLGRLFQSLDERSREYTVSYMKSRNRYHFTWGFSIGLGQNFRYLDEIAQEHVLRWTEHDESLADGLGKTLAEKFPSLDESAQKRILRSISISKSFARAFGTNIGAASQYFTNEVIDQFSSLTSTPMTETNGKSNPSGADKGVEHYRDFANFPSVCGVKLVDEMISPLEEGQSTEVSFSGCHERVCVCFIDIVNSTNIAAGLKDHELSRYYALFLNSMAMIAKNFMAQIIKNAGDSLILYFPETSDSSKTGSFQDVIECLLTMVDAHQDINSKLLLEELPPLHFRISADYGNLQKVKSASSQHEDLFGSTMNICAKINSKAEANGVVIGESLYTAVSSLDFANLYLFTKISSFSILGKPYQVYSVSSVKSRHIVNPFNRAAENIQVLRSFGNPHLYAASTRSLEGSFNSDNLGRVKSDTLQGNRGPTVLLIDDEEDVLFIYRMFLAEAGYIVEPYSSAKNALERLQTVSQSYYDIVVTDIRMPEINGLQLYKLIKSINKDLKIVFLTGLDTSSEMFALFPDVELKHLIRKPVNKNSFIKALELALGK